MVFDDFTPEVVLPVASVVAANFGLLMDEYSGSKVPCPSGSKLWRA